MSRCVLFFLVLLYNKRLYACIDKHKQVVHSLSACNYNDTVRRYIPCYAYTHAACVFHTMIIQYYVIHMIHLYSPMYVGSPCQYHPISKTTSQSEKIPCRLTQTCPKHSQRHGHIAAAMGSGGTFPMASGKSTSKASVEGSVEGYVLWIFNFQSYVSYVL